MVHQAIQNKLLAIVVVDSIAIITNIIVVVINSFVVAITIEIRAADT
jgi:hypothetical protein